VSTFGSVVYWLGLPLAIVAFGAVFVLGIRRPETGRFGAIFLGVGFACTIFSLLLLWIRFWIR
jgi:hypothetical protein